MIGDEDSPEGDWVLTEKVSYWFGKPRRWQIVLYRHAHGFDVAKRVVGLPGETIGIENERVTIDGELVPVPEELQFLKYYGYAVLREGKTYPCKRGYFLLGDFSHDSLDSRFYGELAPSRIRGRAWLIVWPPSRLRWLAL